MFKVAYRLTDSSADARDVLHDVFCRLPDALARFDCKRPLWPWLQAVTTRTTLAHFRKTKERGEIPLPDGSVDNASHERAVLDSIELERALSTLTAEQRTVVVLKELLGYSHEEIGELLGLPPSTSRGRLYRARAALRVALGDK